MKVVVLIAILAVLFFVLGARRGKPREPEASTPPPPPASPPAPQPMLRCAECGMHLPADEALPGKGGVFCSASHRATFEARST